MTPDALLTAAGLEFSYRPGESFLNIPEFRLNPGSVTLLTGPNGSGKSTFLKLLAGLLSPQRGTIERTADSLFLVRQDPYLFSGTLESNLDYALRLKRLPPGDRLRRIDEALDRMELRDLRKRKVAKLSGGEAKRTAIARALVLDPEILILDEPSASLDARSVRIIAEVITELRDQGRGILTATHDPLLTELLNGNTLCLCRGELS